MRAELTVAHDPRILDLFAAEDRKIRRASYTITERDERLVFTVEADDAVAMRAMLSSILKLLALWEKTEDL